MNCLHRCNLFQSLKLVCARCPRDGEDIGVWHEDNHVGSEGLQVSSKWLEHNYTVIAATVLILENFRDEIILLFLQISLQP